MKCLFWNIRGAGRARFLSSTRTSINNHSIDICVFFDPRVSADKAICIAHILGFSNYHLQEARGFSRGIWFCWNGDSTNLEIISLLSKLLLLLSLSKTNGGALTAVYGSSQAAIRRGLWSMIDMLTGNFERINLSWLLTGDFNDIISLTEKKGGNSTFTNTCFSNCIERIALMDLGFRGSKFTWVKSIIRTNSIRYRLDRDLCSATWKYLYPDSLVTHLLRFESNHNPLLVSLFSSHIPVKQLKPFRFFAMWIDHDDFGKMVADTWDN